MSYQPGYKDGREVGTGERDAAGRYEAIKRELQGHTGFSVLDVGAYSGYFSYRLADDFGARCLAIDKVRTLEEREGVAVRRGLIYADELEAIEYGIWDVTLLLSVLHHMPDWRRAFAAVVGFSVVTFVEIPDPREVLPNAIMHPESAVMHEAAQAIGGIVVGWSPGYDSRYSRPTYAIGRLG